MINKRCFQMCKMVVMSFMSAPLSEIIPGGGAGTFAYY